MVKQCILPFKHYVHLPSPLQWFGPLIPDTKEAYLKTAGAELA